MSDDAPRPSLAAARDNWRRSPLPVASRLRLALRNNWIKLRTRSDCCGNHGQPGC